MEPGVVQDDRDLLPLIGLARQATHHEGDLLGVLVSLDGVDPHFLGRQAQCPEERPARLLAVHVQPCSLPLGKPHAPGLGLVLHPDLVDGTGLPALLEQIVDLAPDLGHPPGDGLLVAAPHERVGEPEAHARQAHEQPVGGLRPVLDAEPDGHDVLKGRDVPETGFDARLRGRSTENLLQLLLLRPLELCRVLVAGVTGYHGAQPVSPPFRQPLAYRLLGSLDHLRDNIQANAAGSVHNRLRLHSHQPVGVRALLPPDEDVPFLVRHVDLHATILYEVLRKHQPGIPQQPPQNAILFNSSHSETPSRSRVTSA